MPLSTEALLAAVTERLEREPARPVMLYTEPRTEYRRMIEVYDQLVDGVESLHLLTEGDRRAYRETFGVDPWQSACTDRSP